MQQHIYYIRYALRFADMQIPQLVTIFISAVYDGATISFAHPVRYSLADNKVVIC